MFIIYDLGIFLLMKYFRLPPMDFFDLLSQFDDKVNPPVGEAVQ